VNIDLANIESQFEHLVNKQLELKQLSDQEIFQDFIEDLIDDFEVGSFFSRILFLIFSKFDEYKS